MYSILDHDYSVPFLLRKDNGVAHKLDRIYLSHSTRILVYVRRLVKFTSNILKIYDIITSQLPEDQLSLHIYSLRANPISLNPSLINQSLS